MANYGLEAVLGQLAGFGLTWLMQSSVLLGLGLAAGRVLRRSGPAVQSGVYRTTLLAVVVCPFASAALGAAGFDGLSLRLPTQANDPLRAERAAHDELRPIGPPSVTPPDLLRSPEQSADSPPIKAEHTSLTVVDAAPAAAPGRFALRLDTTVIAAVFVAIWLVGSTFMAFWLCVGWARMRRLRSSAAPAEPAAEALCRDIARQLKVGSPSVWRSPFLFSPCLDGLRCPAILLPDDVGSNLRETFIHELAHLLRRDGLWNWLRRWMNVALWAQPLLWVLSRRLEATSEEVCDDYVVHSGAKRSAYAGHLLELAGRSLPPIAPASVGMVSLRSLLARRVVRILDTSRAISTRAGTRAVVVMVAVGLALTVLAGLLGINDKHTAGASTADLVTDSGPDPTGKKVHGQVVGPDGRPMPGATVIAWRMRLDGPRIDDEHVTRKASVIARKTTGNDGRYEFDFETAEVAAAARVIATAPGSGLGYRGKDDEIRLTAGDLPIAGRLVDLEGRPVAGAKVALGQVMLPPSDAAPIVTARQSGAPVTKTRMTSPSQPPTGNPLSMSGRMLMDATCLLSDGLVTDGDGRFRIEGLGRDVVANLTISGPTIAFKQVQVLTRAMDRVGDDNRDPSVRGLGDAATYGATCTITVEPTRPIEGFVRDAVTNQPIPGAIVTAAALSGSMLHIEGFISTETDAQGHYRLLGLPKEGAAGHKLTVYPPLDRPYFESGRLEAPAKPGFEPLSFDISLKSGIWIRGKVTEVATGKPVAAAVDYFPMITNKHAEDYPNFDPNITASLGIDTATQDGRRRVIFYIVGLPGEGVVTVHTDDSSYLGGFGAESIKGRTGQDQLLTV